MKSVKQEMRGVRLTQTAMTWTLGLLILAFGGSALAAKARLSVQGAVYREGQLQVKGSYRGRSLPADSQIDLYDRKLGRLIGQLSLTDLPAKKNKRPFRFTLSNPYDIPCAVRVSAEGAKDKFRKVRGAPKKNCSTGKTPPVAAVPAPTPEPAPIDPAPTPTPTPTPSLQPICEILEPVAGTTLTAHTPVTFRGRLKANDATAPTLDYEWDFAGGAMERPKGTVTGEEPVEAQSTFVRGNSRYRVRLAAIDKSGRRCEAAVDVAVGKVSQAPGSSASLAAASQNSAPAPGRAAMQKGTGEAVILPYEDWGMQCGTDSRLVPNVWVTYLPPISNLKAQVYEKARLPAVLTGEAVSLTYVAASNPKDPAGADSINSTSQNWPLGTPLMQAEIQKSDLFETKPAESGRTLADGYFNGSWISGLEMVGAEGYQPDEGVAGKAGQPPLNPDHGRYMPGIANPYGANDAQAFSGFLTDEHSFIARLLPLTDIDDAGRVNPYPLFRVEARRGESTTPVASTDVVMTAGRDLHCRECHEKGGLGANPAIYPEHAGHDPNNHDHGGGTGATAAPAYQDPAGASLFDREYAAIHNLSALHDYLNPGWYLLQRMDEGYQYSNDGVIHYDKSTSCDGDKGCHTTALTQVPFNQPLYVQSGPQPLSLDIHEFHGQLQYAPNQRDIVRNEYGRPVRWDVTKGPNPSPVFPVKDAGGNILPMEQNCLRCHGGQREQCYRDRMYTAGITCYQCHGDMLAVSGSFRHNLPEFPERITYRQFWFDQPDCGACHTGNGNIGKDAAGGYFSAAVRKTAFDETDPAAAPRKPDVNQADERRFAVPVSDVDVGMGGRQYHYDEATGNNYNFGTRETIPTPLFRAARDSHGDVPCAACHGAAHAIWPNRDPSANDNVTATQLQGHAGHVVECGVCHAADAFAEFKNLDGGRFSGLPEDSGVLGGPHNLHPINEPTWWLQVGTGSAGYGGWHDDVYRRPGFDGVDQCAACHGSDHVGTRLSKAAVDREFVLPTGITARWKAGEPIGCDQCHTLEHSFKGQPVGGGLPANRPPAITSRAVTTAEVGKPYRYQIEATDPENLPLHYQIFPIPMGGSGTPLLQIDAATGLLTGSFPPEGLASFPNPPWTFDFNIAVRDGLGASATQAVSLKIDCPAGSTWSNAFCQSDTIHLAADPLAVLGLTAGQTYRHQLDASHSDGLPLSFELRNAPSGMTVSAKGLIEWVTGDLPLGEYASPIVTARDGQGRESRVTFNVTVCDTRHPWKTALSGCEPMMTVTSKPPVSGHGGETYVYQMVVAHREKLPLKFHFENWNALGGEMNMDAATGQFTWKIPADIAEGQYYLGVYAEDSLGEQTSETLAINVCTGKQRWSDATAACVGSVTITSQAPGADVGAFGVNPGVKYHYQVAATHKHGLPLTFSLSDGPSSMKIDAQSGLIDWINTEPISNSYNPTVTVSDGAGGVTHQTIYVSACAAPQHWDADSSTCAD